MGNSSRMVSCCDCGAPTPYYRGGAYKDYCFECGLARATRAAIEQKAKSGPVYERWLRSKGPLGRPITPYDGSV